VGVKEGEVKRDNVRRVRVPKAGLPNEGGVAGQNPAQALFGGRSRCWTFPREEKQYSGKGRWGIEGGSSLARSKRVNFKKAGTSQRKTPF